MVDSSRTDPRFHAAYQRGYQGPAPEVRRREEEAYRRPRRPGGRVARMDPGPRVEAAEPVSPFAGLTFAPDPADVEAAEDRDSGTGDRRQDRAADRDEQRHGGRDGE